MSSNFVTAQFLRRLSVSQRQELIEHVPGARPVTVAARADGARLFTIRKLIELNLLKGDDKLRPRFTFLTDAGREAAAAVLGEYADALVAAGCLDRSQRPIDLVNLIKADAERQRLVPGRFGKDYDRHARPRRADS